MLVRIRVGIADRPGSLGALATALGRNDADIVAIHVLESEAGRALDDFIVRVRSGDHLAAACSALERVLGAVVVGVQQPVPQPSGHAELELVGQVLARPERGLQTLVDGLPGALGTDWAAVVQDGPVPGKAVVVVASMRYPGHEHVSLKSTTRLGNVEVAQVGGQEPYGAAAMAPVGTSGTALLVVREHGLQFHRSELDRLGELGSIAAHVIGSLAVA